MRFLLTILIIGGLVAAAFCLRDKRDEMRTQAWAVQVMPFMRSQTDGTLNRCRAGPAG